MLKKLIVSENLLFFLEDDNQDLIKIAIMLLIAALVDALGVASVVPIIGLIIRPESYFDLKESVSFLEVITYKEVLGILLTIFVFSIVFRIFSTYRVVKYALEIEAKISAKMFENAIGMQYEKFISIGRDEQGRNILTEVGHVVNGALMARINLVASLSILVTMLIVLYIYSPFITITILTVFGGSYILIYYLIKKILLIVGIERVEANEKRFKILRESFDLFKDIKIQKLEKNIIDEFEKSSWIYAKSQAKTSIIAQIPKFILEGLVFTSLIIFMYIWSQSGDTEDVLSIAALFAAAGYKILPAMQKVYSSLVTLRYSNHAIFSLKKSYDLLNINTYDKKRTNINYCEGEVGVNLKNITFSFSGKRNILNNVNFNVSRGEICVLVGKSGSGKSTTLDVIAGLLRVNSGIIEFDREIKCLGYCAQKVQVFSGTIAQNICMDFTKDKFDENEIQRLYEAVRVSCINEFMNSIEDVLNFRINDFGENLSGGQIQRIGIARAIYKKPELIIMDEATSSLDSSVEKRIFQNLKSYCKENKAIIIHSSHRPYPVEMSDKIVNLN